MAYLSPVLFVAFINDLLGEVSSRYANDTKVYGPVNNSEDKLQKNIYELVDWADFWQLRFNADKCKCTIMGKNNEQRCYKMRNHGSSDGVTLK